ncbi:MAG: hypothetical protein JW775_07145, partial [Candidatus Aminicenantes bacterium]|nr:hypothetical protein [Candidatus Aminicenantes bacterium]
GGGVPFPHLVPLAAGLAAADAVREAGGLEVRLKWPNDIVHGGRKLGGVLAEGAHGAAAESFAVVGIGLNIGQGPDDFPEALREASTSIALAGGRAVAVEALFGALCRTLERWYNVLARGDSEAVVRTFENLSAIPPGAAVEVETADGAFAAEYRGLDAQGRLVVARPGTGARALDSVLKLVRTP